jgi:hypothetical protein
VAVSNESEDSDNSASILDILTQTFRTLKVADKTMSAPAKNLVTSPTPSIKSVNFSSFVASPLVKAIAVGTTGMSRDDIKPPSDDIVFSTHLKGHLFGYGGILWSRAHNFCALV